LLILAGVGTGKTETLMHKYAYLISHIRVQPRNIMSVTFTNKAAKEMKKRAVKILQCSFSDLDDAYINTFHSLSYRILRERDNYLKVGLKDEFHVLDTSDQKRLIKEALKDDKNTKDTLMRIVKEVKMSKGDISQVREVPYGKVAKAIDKFKNSCIFPEDE
jgi:DNA helicase-2/ATP-dependent DNA helicase PcrA